MPKDFHIGASKGGRCRLTRESSNAPEASAGGGMMYRAAVDTPHSPPESVLVTLNSPELGLPGH